jgi:ribosome-binding factor A
MPLPFKRADRVAGLIQEELSRLLRRAVKDPRLHQVTITAVRLSLDLRHARVFFTGPGGQAGLAEELKGLRRAAGFLRGHLGRTLRLRYAPELTFEVDDSVERSLHIAALLKQLKSSQGDEGPEGG